MVRSVFALRVAARATATVSDAWHVRACVTSSPPTNQSARPTNHVGTHSLRDATGRPVIGSGTTFGPGGRHSHELMNAHTDTFHLDAVTGTLPADPRFEDTSLKAAETGTALPDGERPSRDLLERVLDGLKRLTFDDEQ